MKRSFEEIKRDFPRAGRESLIRILQAIQSEEGYLSKENIELVSQYLGIPPSKVYGVASFYDQFRFAAPAKYNIKVCRGVSCHLERSQELVEHLARELRTEVGKVTRDGLFSVEQVTCLGACGLGPVVSINDEYFTEVSRIGLSGILAELRKKAIDGA